jgi:hypothetical protein
MPDYRINPSSWLTFARASASQNMTATDPADEPPGVEGGGVAGREYRRGLAPLVFVPWDQVQTSPLNLPVEKMYFYVPG